MDQPIRQTRKRESSEGLRRRIAYSFANKVNTFRKFEKTPEEKKELRKVQSEHKNALKAHYGADFNRNKTFNLPQFKYEITLST